LCRVSGAQTKSNRVQRQLPATHVFILGCIFMPTLDARFERHRSRENWRIPSINFDYVTCFNAENEHRALAWKSSHKVTRFTKYRELPPFWFHNAWYSKLQSLSLRFFNAAISIFDNKGFRTIKGIGNREQEFQPIRNWVFHNDFW